MNSEYLKEIIENATSIKIEEIVYSSNSIYGKGQFHLKDVFFKLLSPEEAKSEAVNLDNAKTKIDLPQLEAQFHMEGKVLLVYEYKRKDEGRITGAEFIANPTFSVEYVEQVYSQIFDKLKEGHQSSIHLNSSENYPLRVLYETRKDNGRLYSFYGENFEGLLNDMKEVSSNYKKQILELMEYDINETLFSLNHGDIHDWNYAIKIKNGNYQSICFFDAATVGYNPILSDFATYYRYLALQSSYLFPIYRKGFIGTLKDPKDYIDKQNTIFHLFQNTLMITLIGIGLQKKPDWKWKQEFASRLIYRFLGIKNILEYKLEDRNKLYNIIIKVLDRSKTSINIIDLPLGDNIYTYLDSHD